MAKHPHRIMLRDKKTWRCMLPGCRYFIHLGLTHTLSGQMIICWECGEQFMCDDQTVEKALIDDMPKCAECHMRLEGYDPSIMHKILEEKGLLEKPTGLAAFGARDYTPVIERIKTTEEKDEIEVIEDEGGHAPDCGIYDGGECTCQ